MTIRALWICAVAAITVVASPAVSEGTRPGNTLSILERLSIHHAEIDWKVSDEGAQKVAAVSLIGAVELPTESDFRSLEPTALLNLYLGERLLINAPVFYTQEGDGSDRWISTDANGGKLFMEIVWESPRVGMYRMRGKFHPGAFALDVAQEPAKLTFVLSIGRAFLTQEASVRPERWSRIAERYWRTGIN